METFIVANFWMIVLILFLLIHPSFRISGIIFTSILATKGFIPGYVFIGILICNISAYICYRIKENLDETPTNVITKPTNARRDPDTN